MPNIASVLKAEITRIQERPRHRPPAEISWMRAAAVSALAARKADR